jgi:hypothetical protein
MKGLQNKMKMDAGLISAIYSVFQKFISRLIKLLFEILRVFSLYFMKGYIPYLITIFTYSINIRISLNYLT